VRPSIHSGTRRQSSITEDTITCQGRPASTVSIKEFRNGKVVDETQYFADPFGAPAWRKQWVQQIA
jgi:hypothetical protein